MKNNIQLFINYSSKVGVDILSKVVVLISLPIIIRNLSPDEYGKFVFISVLASYLGIFNEFGYSLNGINLLSKAKEGKEKVVKTIISLKTVLISFSFIITLFSFFFRF